ncbi:MAG TPA: glycosyltransferase family 4 protein [Phycisphaerae bacterium]|nr:glycosyltransferase family 4 protein [Phycisphaerae bacterium]
MALGRTPSRKKTPSRTRRGGPRIAVIGNYVPRRCGIATFTAGVCEALAEEVPEAHVAVVAMNDRPEGYDYPPRVEFQINADRLEDYYNTFNFIQAGGFDFVNVQHEYGIFGGEAGSHLLALVRQLRMPHDVTLHTVLKSPSPAERRVLEELVRLADRLVVMSPRSIGLLEDVYGVERNQVCLIHHGIPDVPPTDPDAHKAEIGAEGRRVILTFGLLSPGKGIEYVIEAMPAVVAQHPDVLYVVLGATHPNIRRQSGETYRTKLEKLARERGVADHVVFQNEFVGLRKLFQYLTAADLYVSPYLNQDQAVSGTLAYAMGTGKPIISTTYWYALDMLTKGCGRLVPPRDSEALAWACVDLLTNEAERTAMGERAYAFSRQMIWPEVARQYLALFKEIQKERESRPEPVLLVRSPDGATLGLEEAVPGVRLAGEFPAVNLEHLRRLTDDFGIMQHARYIVPDRRRGYTTDDNARALIAAILERYVTPDDPTLRPLVTRYLSFVDLAFNVRTRRFRNFLSYGRRWLEEEGSEDSHGRALWALGTTVAMDQDTGHRLLAADLLREALPAVEEIPSLRCLAFTLLGIHAYLERFGDDPNMRRAQERIAKRLHGAFRTSAAADGWPWPEPTVTYANARLPQALILAGDAMGEPEMLAKGLDVLHWLVQIQRSPNGWFSPIGNQGWYERGKQKAQFDQQPTEAHDMVEACLTAYGVTHEAAWLDHARVVFEWFLGRNDILMPLYDPSSGGCRDGLHPDRPNENQGAESTLAWLLALLRIHLHQRAIESDRPGRSRRTPRSDAGTPALADPAPEETP